MELPLGRISELEYLANKIVPTPKIVVLETSRRALSVMYRALSANTWLRRSRALKMCLGAVPSLRQLRYLSQRPERTSLKRRHPHCKQATVNTPNNETYFVGYVWQLKRGTHSAAPHTVSGTINPSTSPHSSTLLARQYCTIHLRKALPPYGTMPCCRAESWNTATA